MKKKVMFQCAYCKRDIINKQGIHHEVKFVRVKNNTHQELLSLTICKACFEVELFLRGVKYEI